MKIKGEGKKKASPKGTILVGEKASEILKGGGCSTGKRWCHNGRVKRGEEKGKYAVSGVRGPTGVAAST